MKHRRNIVSKYIFRNTFLYECNAFTRDFQYRIHAENDVKIFFTVLEF